MFLGTQKLASTRLDNQTIKCREQHGQLQCDCDARPPGYDPQNSGAAVGEVACGNPERAGDVVMAASDDHGNGAKADLGDSRELP